MAKLEEIDKSTLKVGDEIAIRDVDRPDNIYNSWLEWKWWRKFENSFFVYLTIAKISDDRRIFTSMIGMEFGDYIPFYKINEETDRQNRISESVSKIQQYLDKLNYYVNSGKAVRASDDKILKIEQMIKELCKEIEEE